MNEFRVQNAVFPKLTLCTEKRLYFRANDLVDISLTEPKITFATGGRLVTNTYFNSISVGKLKKYTDFKELVFTIRAAGHFKLIWKVKALNQSDRILQENEIRAEKEGDVVIPLPFWPALKDGMLYFELHALSPGKVADFFYVTQEKPAREVKIGMVITHFNRQKEVLRVAERLKTELLDDPDYAPYLSLCIVDNSQNLPPIEGVTVLKNPNLGGSGGFARGLSYFADQKDVTHCLFMDDDAASEAESTKRTLFYLAYAKDPKIAIAGAMLRVIAPNRQHESGARVDGLCHPVKPYYDLLKINDLLLNEREERIDYAGWWYFAFPLKSTKFWPFPYFIRGDDVGFSLANRFPIVTVNGIASWQDDFAAKTGPWQIYLDQRSQTMHFFHGLIPGQRKRDFIVSLSMLFILHLLNYQYESARATTLALKDILQGDNYWLDNIDPTACRQKIKQITHQEVIVSIPEELRQSARPAEPREGSIRRFFRLLSLNGHLIPRFFFHKAPVWQYRNYGVRVREVFLYRTVLSYTQDDQSQGVILEHNKRLFFSYAWDHLRVALKLYRRRSQLQAQYEKSYPKFTSAAFWQEQFRRFAPGNNHKEQK